MKSNLFRSLRGHLLREGVTLLLFTSLMLQSVQAAAPGWWSTQGALKSPALVDDYAALNQGQLKNFVRAAIYELHAKLPGGAGALLNTLLNTWRTQKLNSDDYAAVTVGQLKAVATPVYASMQAAGLTLPVPWTELATDDDDYAIANIGQAKAVFAFVVPDLALLGTVKTDSDGDGFSDVLELALGTDPNSAASHPAGMSGDMTGGDGTGGGGTGGGGPPPYTDPYPEPWPDFDSATNEEKDTDEDEVPDAKDRVPYDANFTEARSGKPHYNIVDMGKCEAGCYMADSGALIWREDFDSNFKVWTPENPVTTSITWSPENPGLENAANLPNFGDLYGDITNDGAILGEAFYIDPGLEDPDNTNDWVLRYFLFHPDAQGGTAEWLPFTTPDGGTWYSKGAVGFGLGGNLYGATIYLQADDEHAEDQLYTSYFNINRSSESVSVQFQEPLPSWSYPDLPDSIPDDSELGVRTLMDGVHIRTSQYIAESSEKGTLRCTTSYQRAVYQIAFAGDWFTSSSNYWDTELEDHMSQYTQTWNLDTAQGTKLIKEADLLSEDGGIDLYGGADGYYPIWDFYGVSQADVPWLIGRKVIGFYDGVHPLYDSYIVKPDETGEYQPYPIYASAKDKDDGKPITDIRLLTAQGQALVYGDFDEESAGDEAGLWADGEVEVISNVISGYDRYDDWKFWDVSRDGMMTATAWKNGDAGPEQHLLLLIPFVMMQVKADGHLAQVGNGVSASLPSPIIDMQCSVTAVRMDSEIGPVGDLSVSGTITSAFCDTIKGDKGKITAITLWVNGEDEPFATIDVDSEKGENGSINHPYPYLGTFNTTIEDVPLTDGNNLFQFTAADQVYKISGYSVWTTSIDVTSPVDDATLTNPNGTFALTASLPVSQLSDSTADNVIVTVNQDGSNHPGITLVETAASSGVFSGSFSDNTPIRLTLYDASNLSNAIKEDLRVSLLVGNPGTATAYDIAIHESTAGSRVFSGGYVSSSAGSGAAGANNVGAPVPPEDGTPPNPTNAAPPQLVVTMENYSRVVAVSNGGELNVYAMVAGMPDEIAAQVRVQVGNNKYKFIKHAESGLIVAVEDTGDENDPNTLALMSFQHSGAPPSELAEKDENNFEEAKGLSFMEGISKGLNAGGVDMVNSIGDVTIGWVKYAGRGLVVYGLEIRLITRLGVGGDEEEIEELQDLLTEWGAPNVAINDQAISVAGFLAPLLANTVVQAAQVHMAMVTGNVDLLVTALHGSEEHKTIFMVISTALQGAMKDYEDATEGQKGYICGRIWFEAFAIALPFTKLGKLPKLVQIAALERLKASGLLKAGGIAAVAAEETSLLISKMCFLGGTPVLTKDGLMRIENVKSGMWVWSRDEHSFSSGWKRVVRTFITHPNVIHHLTYELRGPPDALQSANFQTKSVLKNETLGVTATHPFWVGNQERPGFFPASDLKVGDLLCTSDGGSAYVTSNIAEQAADGGTFDTYNFEVEDYHTYFVGESSIWVHNFSKLFCDELQKTINNLLKKMPDGTPLDGIRFKLLDQAFDAEIAAKKAIMSKQGNFAMHVTGVDEISAYAQRFPNGSASNPVEQIASYTYQKEMQKKFAKGAKLDKPSYHYEVHHLCEKRISEALGIPKSKWNTSPGINLPERPPPTNGGFDIKDVTHYHEKFGHDPVYHQGADGIAGAIKNIFDEMDIPYRKVLPNGQKQELVDRLCHLYTYDVRYKHLQLWPATRDWLKKNVPGGCVIPDSVPAVLPY